MSCTVASIRAELTPEQNAKYKDYRIERWIAAKKGNQAEVLKLIAHQCVNEDRLECILTDPQRRQTTMEELSRRVLNFVHIQPKHEVMLYVNTRNQAPQFNEQVQGDALLLCLYYLLRRVEDLEGEGRTAIFVIDMMESPTPRIGDLEGQMRMFSATIGRSFPGLFSQTLLCCNWNYIARKTVGALAKGTGLAAEFVSPADLMSRLGKAYCPTLIGGDYYLDTARSMDVLVTEFYKSAAGKALTRPVIAPSTSVTLKWSSVLARPLQVQRKAEPAPQPAFTDQQTAIGIAAFVVVAFVMGQFLAAIIVAAGFAYMKYYKVDSSPESSCRLVRYILDANYSEVVEVLQSINPAVDLQDLDTQNGTKMESAALALTACLRAHQKEELKRCLKTLLDVVSMMATNAEVLPCLGRWQRIFQYLRAVGRLQVACPCGCRERGDLDWLDDHYAAAPTRCMAVAMRVLPQSARRASSPGSNSFSTATAPATHLRQPSYDRTSSRPTTPDDDKTQGGTPEKRRFHQWRDELEQRKDGLKEEWRRMQSGSPTPNDRREQPLPAAGEGRGFRQYLKEEWKDAQKWL